MKLTRPIFVAIEGIDGCGKSTFVELLAPALGCHLLRCPPEELGEVRKMFDMNDIAHKLFYASANMVVSKRVSELLRSGESVICDRYWLSTKVYSSVREEDINIDIIEDHLARPDFTIYLHLDEPVRRKRMVKRGKMNEIDLRSMADVDRLKEGYDVELGKKFSGQVVRADTGSSTPEELVRQVCAKLRG